MDIIIHEHITSSLKLSFTGDNSECYTINIDGEYGNVYSVQTFKTSCHITQKFQTGHYIITVRTGKNTVAVAHSIVPAICRLTTGGCGFLVSHNEKTFLMTANHCIPTPEIAENCVAFFETCSTKLDHKTFWKMSHRYCNGGSDFTCVGISEDTVETLRKSGITGHKLSDATDVEGSDQCVLVHFNTYNGDNMLRTVCKIKSMKSHCLRYNYLDGFPSSHCGSSGSPLYGFNKDNKLCITGLHVGKGKGTSITCIRKDL